MLVLAKSNAALLKSWGLVRFGDLIADTLLGLVRSINQQSDTKGTAYLKMNNLVSDGSLDLKRMVYVKTNLDEIKKYSLQNGDLLFNTRNSYELVGKTGVWDSKIEPCIFNNNIMRIRFKEGIKPKFLNYYMSSHQFRNSLLSVKKATTNICAIYAKDLNAQLIPIAPNNEQNRIIEKIDELFSIVDSNLKIISTFQIRIKNFKQSLLQNAFNGNLTKNWRNSNSHLTSGQDLIEQLKNINKDFVEIPSDVLKLLPKIPSEWSWSYLSNLGALSRGKSKHRPRNDPKLFGGKYPFIQTGIVRNSNRKILHYNQTYNETGLAQSRLFPEGTLCITIAANIAETSILTFPSCFPDSIVGFIGIDKIINTWLIMYYIKSYQEKLDSIAPATAQKNINLDILQKVAVPAMSLEEQNHIVDKLEIEFSLVDNFSKNLETQIKSLINFKIAILKQAFEGKLVPQDPNDEPASELLKRIKTDKK